MNEYIKPPIGVSPHWYIHNKRIEELSEAITRYSDFIMRYVNIKDERDYYKSGEQLQLILTDGTVMIIHSRDCILYNGTLPTAEKH